MIIALPLPRDNRMGMRVLAHGTDGEASKLEDMFAGPREVMVMLLRHRLAPFPRPPIRGWCVMPVAFMAVPAHPAPIERVREGVVQGRARNWLAVAVA